MGEFITLPIMQRLGTLAKAIDGAAYSSGITLSPITIKAIAAAVLAQEPICAWCKQPFSIVRDTEAYANGCCAKNCGISPTPTPAEKKP